jgi:hypothetical protein
MKLRIKPVNKKIQAIILIICWSGFFYIVFFPHHIFGTITTGQAGDKLLAIAFPAIQIPRIIFGLIDVYRKPSASAKSSS